MKIKSFFSHTIEDAIAKARQEWGPDAMLIQSRKAAREARHLGEYEVVFADGTPPSEASATSNGSPEAGFPSAGDRLATEVGALKQQLENMRRTISRTVLAPSQWSAQGSESQPLLSETYTLLTAAEISAELAREVVQSAASRAGVSGDQRNRPTEKLWHAAITEEIGSRCRIDAGLGVGESRQRIVALIGPPGSGKTTTLVKLAVTYGLANRRSVFLLSTDTYRIAAAEQLRSYAAILGVGFYLAETMSAVVQVIEENRAKDLILIDTPGLGFAELQEHAPLARFLSTRTDIDRHLVLSSSVKSADLSRVIDSYEIFRPQRLLFTRLDETVSPGGVINEAARTRKPLSFLATGQRIPEDLEAATLTRLISPILGRPVAEDSTSAGSESWGTAAAAASGDSPAEVSSAA
jgi:flagellar biosynthesis protein FlhF